ncbi:MAG: DUF2284 domain-containing protein [Deltaproteobacteria bacterium]
MKTIARNELNKKSEKGYPPFNKKITVRKIVKEIPGERIDQDLEKYRSMAMNMGALSATIISSDEIIIDERVRAKCMYPKCDYYGKSINCPPYAPDLDLVRKIIKKYHHAILFCVKDDTGVFFGSSFRSRVGRKIPSKMILNTICAEIESRSFYDGYQFSLAFGQGPCKSFWCKNQPCAALHPGKGCRFALKARSSMEAVGMDVFSMAANQGWEIYPCGERVKEKDIPHVLLVGLVLIW